MNDPEDAGKYCIENQQPVQGQVVGDHNVVHQHFHPTSGSIHAAPSVPVWNVPFSHNPFFTGREEILAQIRSRFQTGQVTALSQPQAMSGLGGIGKTQIAIEYAHRYRRDYQAVLWTRADSREALVSGYVAIAYLLNLPQKDEQDQALVMQAVLRWLTAQAGWLLVRRAGLVTHDAPLEAALPADLTLAREITEELGGLPLALDQAGAYVEETQCGLARYLQLYRLRRTALLQRRGGVVSDHPEPGSIGSQDPRH